MSWQKSFDVMPASRRAACYELLEEMVEAIDTGIS